MQLSAAPASDTLIQKGVATSPSAGANIANIQINSAAGTGDVGLGTGDIGPGKWLITLQYCLTGTAETALTNLQILSGAFTNITGIPTISGSGWNTISLVRTVAPWSGNINILVQPTANATTGAVYSVIITVSRIA